jgi:glycosidase
LDGSRGNLGNEILYYITIDRFFDAVVENNIPNYAFPVNSQLAPETQTYNQANRLIIEHTYDPSHRYTKLYWGGDLAGIIEKLDYLQDLGVTQLVLSGFQDSANALVYTPDGKSTYLHEKVKPENEDFNPFYDHASAGFNSAWLKDWFEIDEHFRNPTNPSLNPDEVDRFAVFRHLLDEAGERGIGIIVELNLNYTSPHRGGYPYGPFNPKQYELWTVDNSNVYRQGQLVARYEDVNSGELNPEGWFHEPVQINYDRPTPEMLENGPIGGFPDLDQANPELKNYLLEAAQFWLTFNPEGQQISGFYLPFIPNINATFWHELETTVLATNPDAILIGDYENGGYRNQGTIKWYENTESYSLMNHDLSVASRRFFGRDRGWDGRTVVLRENLLGPEGQYYNYSLPQRWLHYIFNPSQSLEVPRHSLDVVKPEDAQAWVNFVESPDWPRLLTYYPKMSKQSYASAIKFLFTTAGVPMLMYGVETGLALPYHIGHQSIFGMGGKPFNQQMMIWPGQEGWNSALYQVTQAMTQLRRQYPVLRYGQTQFLFPVGSLRDKDIFMLRQLPHCHNDSESDCAQILYAYSTEGGDFNLSLDAPELSQSQEVESGIVTSVTSSNLTISLKPEESKVIVLK